VTVGRTGLARALSKLGFCSRREARELILGGRVRVNTGLCRDPGKWVELGRDRIEVDAQLVQAEPEVYLMLNKPRGLVTTASDEQGRATVFECFGGVSLPVLSPVGRLDKASEGLLLFSNDTTWAARITDPRSEFEKTYHVQVNCVAEAHLMARLQTGIRVDDEFLSARRVSLLRQGTRNSWLEFVLTEGKNRHIRRLLAAFDIEALRLVRVAIGPLKLGSLAKGAFRHLTKPEIRLLQSWQR
jgi:23S rRNA pseudouridine2605 synthase